MSETLHEQRRGDAGVPSLEDSGPTRRNNSRAASREREMTAECKGPCLVATQSGSSTPDPRCAWVPRSEEADPQEVGLRAMAILGSHRYSALTRPHVVASAGTGRGPNFSMRWWYSSPT
jgi:hypothetical protein